MENKITNKELKAIMYSKRANIYYLEKCRVMQKDGRVLYLTDKWKENLYWNIPIANTTVILLGTGTSITQAAIRLLASAGVLVGFSGGGATPLISGVEVEWMTPANEYRPTEFVQKWCSFWYDDAKRLEVAKFFQKKRCDFLTKCWIKDIELQDNGFYLDDMEIESAISSFSTKIKNSASVQNLLLGEALFTKNLYKYAATKLEITDFIRDHSGGDTANDFLNHGNYLAYGMAATVLWVLGIPHAFAVMHGKTRRGALVFDVADLIKDSIVLPWSFIGAYEGVNEQSYRNIILQKFIEHKALDYMFKVVEEACNISVGDSL